MSFGAVGDRPASIRGATGNPTQVHAELERVERASTSPAERHDSARLD